MTSLSPGGVAGAVADFLFVDVDDVLHQQVPLEAVDAVAIQDDFLSAGRAAEAAAVHRHGGSSLEQRGLGHKDHKDNGRNITSVSICCVSTSAFQHPTAGAGCHTTQMHAGISVIQSLSYELNYFCHLFWDLKEFKMPAPCISEVEIESAGD